MKIVDIVVLKEVENDLENVRHFPNLSSINVGSVLHLLYSLFRYRTISFRMIAVFGLPCLFTYDMPFLNY